MSTERQLHTDDLVDRTGLPGGPGDKPRVSSTSWLLLGLIVVAGLGVTALSLGQPPFADGYALRNLFREHPSIIAFASQRYALENGRVTSSVFAWLSIAYRPLYSALVGAAFLLNTWLVVAVGVGRTRLTQSRIPLLLAFAAIVRWFGMPAFNEVVIWLTGSGVYLMTIVLMLTFLLPFKRAIDSPPESRSWGRESALAVPMIVLGVALGASQASAVAGTVMVLAVLLVVAIRGRFAHRLPLHLWSGAAGLAAGGAVLLVSPGTASRAAELSATHGSTPLGHLGYFVLVLGRGIAFVLPIAVAWLTLLALMSLRMPLGEDAVLSTSDKDHRWTSIWLLGAAGTLLPFALVTYPGGGRIYSFGFAFVVLAVMSLFSGSRAILLDVLPRRILIPAVVALLLIMLAEMSGSLLVQQRLRTELASREQVVATQIAEGEQDIVVPRLIITPHRVVPYDDITTDPTDWKNVAAAEWYGVRTIRLSSADASD